MNLPVCIHMGVEPDKAIQRPIENDWPPFGDRDKPFGGFWTAPLHVMYGSDWIRGCKENYMEPLLLKHNQPEQHAWVVYPSPDARILHIEDSEDYEILCQLYPLPTGAVCGTLHNDGSRTYEPIVHVDWEKVSEDYDIIWMHREAYRWVRTWDCETVLFTRPEAWVSAEIHEFADRMRERHCDREAVYA